MRASRPCLLLVPAPYRVRGRLFAGTTGGTWVSRSGGRFANGPYSICRLGPSGARPTPDSPGSSSSGITTPVDS